MRNIAIIIVCIFIISTFAWGDEQSVEFGKYWPQWRGPEMTGVAPYGNPPMEWGEDKNVRWKLEVPGKGHATPIVWEDKVFILTAIETDRVVDSAESEKAEQQLPEWRRRMGRRSEKVQEFVILAINRTDGRILWQRAAREEMPHAGTHAEGSWASSSPFTDGEHVYAYFGSRGLYCYDMQGNLVWEKDLGDMATKLSFGAFDRIDSLSESLRVRLLANECEPTQIHRSTGAQSGRGRDFAVITQAQAG